MILIGVYGSSGFGCEVLPLVRSQFAESLARGDAQIVFIDDTQTGQKNGTRILSWEAFTAQPAASRVVTLAVAAAGARRKLEERCRNHGVRFLDVFAANVVRLDEVSLGEGAILCSFVCLTSNIRIGRQFHANIYSYVGHDCVIGDFVTFAPKVCCNGNVTIEDDVYVGTGAMIKQGTPEQPVVIGKGAVIGMGAVVTKSVAPGVVVVGNPARPLAAK